MEYKQMCMYIFAYIHTQMWKFQKVNRKWMFILVPRNLKVYMSEGSSHCSGLCRCWVLRSRHQLRCLNPLLKHLGLWLSSGSWLSLFGRAHRGRWRWCIMGGDNGASWEVTIVHRGRWQWCLKCLDSYCPHGRPHWVPASQLRPRRGDDGGSSVWIPATLTGDLPWVPGIQLQPGPVMAIVGILEWTNGREHSFCIS